MNAVASAFLEESGECWRWGLGDKCARSGGGGWVRFRESLPIRVETGQLRGNEWECNGVEMMMGDRIPLTEPSHLERDEWGPISGDFLETIEERDTYRGVQPRKKGPWHLGEWGSSGATQNQLWRKKRGGVSTQEIETLHWVKGRVSCLIIRGREAHHFPFSLRSSFFFFLFLSSLIITLLF